MGQSKKRVEDQRGCNHLAATGPLFAQVAAIGDSDQAAQERDHFMSALPEECRHFAILFSHKFRRASRISRSLVALFPINPPCLPLGALLWEREAELEAPLMGEEEQCFLIVCFRN